MEQVRQQEQLAKNKRPLFALKTNLLFDVAMMPNIEIEVPIGKRWSINGEYMFPWWLFDGDKYSMPILKAATGWEAIRNARIAKC